MPETSLYLHIPFCIKRCSYCDFITFTNNNSETINKYVEQLCHEIDAYGKEKLVLKTIFFGGGTPSVLKFESLEKIFQSIHKNFQVENEAEITIEINPVNLNRSNLARYRALGINRLSMGVQTFDEKLLAEINRDHRVSDIYKTYYEAREAGFDNYNLDLIFGLPGQKASDWQGTLSKALELKPDHISLYGLDLHDNTPLYEEVTNGKKVLPEEEATIKMFDYARETLKDQNFIHYEISNWAKAGKQARHNVAYWKNNDYIGIGVSAASYYNKKRYKNTDDLILYMKQQDFEPKQKEQELKEEIEETVFMNLRLLQEGLDLKAFQERFKVNFEEYYRDELSYLMVNNLLIKENGHIRLTEEAVFVSNEVFERFIR